MALVRLDHMSVGHSDLSYYSEASLAAVVVSGRSKCNPSSATKSEAARSLLVSYKYCAKPQQVGTEVPGQIVEQKSMGLPVTASYRIPEGMESNKTVSQIHIIR